MTLVIRRATAADAVGVAELLRSAFGESETLFTPALFVAATLTVAQIQQRITQGPIWVATQDDQITGTLGAIAEGNKVYLRSMAVAASMRGQGVGAKLLQEAESYARSVGAKSLYLNTTTFLHSAQRLYERFGFTAYDAGEPELLGTPIIWFAKPIAGKDD